MLRVALCDDEEQQRDKISTLLRSYLAQPGAPAARLSVFSSGYELLSAAEDGADFDLYLLDVVMPEMSGIQLGEKLHRMDRNGTIIYLSVSPEYALDSYDVRAFYYLLKPVQPEKFNQILDQAIAAITKQRDACIAVKTKIGSRRLHIDEIVFVELSQRKARYHLSSGEEAESVTLRIPFKKEVAPLLADSRFFLCGSSFLVNLYYVNAIENGCFRMDDGLQIPWARGQSVLARQRWSNYWLDESKGAGL